MSRVGTSSDSSGDGETVDQRLQSLEDRIDDLERENKQLREELHEERETRTQLIDTIGDTDPADATHEDLLLGGAPVGRMVENVRGRIKQLGKYVLGHDVGTVREDIKALMQENGTLPEQLEEGSVAVSHGGLTESVRERLLPIHEMWIDVREGREQKVPSANERRAARLFGRFIRKAAGEHSVGVDASYNTYSMDSASAREILTGAGDMTQSGKSMTVKRSMKATQRLSKRSDCDCEDLESCDHGVLVWQNDDGHELAVKKERFNAIMSEVEAAINGAVDGPSDPADDEGEASEAQDQDEDGDSVFDNELGGAEPVTNDEEARSKARLLTPLLATTSDRR